MSTLPQLIPGEEVYDLDTFQLQDVQSTLMSVQTDDQHWNKKAKKLLDLIQLELQERNAIVNFATNLQFDELSNANPIYQNNALKAILDDIKNRPNNYLDLQQPDKPIKISQTQVSEVGQQNRIQQDSLSNSTYSSSTTNKLAQKQHKRKNNQINDQMQDILKRTDVTNQKFIIGAAVQQYVPPPPKPKLSNIEKIKAEKLIKKNKKLKDDISMKSSAKQYKLPDQVKGKTVQVQNKQLNTKESEIIELEHHNVGVNIVIKQTSIDHNGNTVSQTTKQQLQPDNQEAIAKVGQGKHLRVDSNDSVALQKHAQTVLAQLGNSNIIKEYNEHTQQQQIYYNNIEVDKNNEYNQSKQQHQQQQQDEHAQLNEQTHNNQYNQPKQTNEFNQLNEQSQILTSTTTNTNTNTKTNTNIISKQVSIVNSEIQPQLDNNISQQHVQIDVQKHILIHDNNNKQQHTEQSQVLNQSQYSQQSQQTHISNQQSYNISKPHEPQEIQSKIETKQISKQIESTCQSQSAQQSQFIQQTHYKQTSTGCDTNKVTKAEQSSEEQIVTEELQCEEDVSTPPKYKVQKELVGKVLSRNSANSKPQFIETKQKPVIVPTNEQKMAEIKQLCDQMDLGEFIPKITGSSTQASSQSNRQMVNKKPRVPLAPQPKQQPLQSKFISKMMSQIDDNRLVDYSDIYPTFQSCFSGSTIANYNHLDMMREIHSIFSQHVERVDNVDSMLNKFKMNPLSINPNELVYINDPKKLIAYASKTGIDIQQYIQRQMVFNERLQSDEQKHSYYFRVVKTKEEVYDIITRSFMRKPNWSELAHGVCLKTSWNVLWTWSKPQIDLNKLLAFQKVNHFAFNKNLARKDLLKKNIERCQKLGQKAAQAFDIIPATFLLPKEYVQFVQRFYKDQAEDGQYNLWIMKPTSKSRGRGITVFNDVSDVMYAEPVVVQKYLNNPLLLKGHKFDMRIYVLVTQFNPLEAFIYKEGFARMTTQPYTLDISELKNQLIHLTNFAVQRTHVQGTDLEQSFGGPKISLRQLKERLYDKNVDWNRIWEQVQDIVVKSLVAAQPEIPHNPNSFELFGYDIIIDSNHKCWLLEVNSSPSLAREYILDELIKQQLIDDIFDLLKPVHFDRSRLCEVLERRILEEQGCKSAINTMNNSKLQCSRDLNYILNGQPIRKYGEMPQQMGGFHMLAPSDRYDKVRSIIQGYKIINGRGTID